MTKMMTLKTFYNYNKNNNEKSYFNILKNFKKIKFILLN